MNINEHIKALFEVRAKIKSCNAELKDLKAEEDELTGMLIQGLADIGLDKVSIKGFGTVSVKEDHYPKIQDWRAFCDFVRDNDAFYFIQQRVASTAFKESVLNLGEEIPGLELGKKMKLSVTKAA